MFSGCVSFSKDTPSKTTNSDFGQNSQAKIIVREFASPIADVSTFNMIVQSVITVALMVENVKIFRAFHLAIDWEFQRDKQF